MNGEAERMIRCHHCSGLANRFERDGDNWLPACLVHIEPDRRNYVLPYPGGYPLPDYHDRSRENTE